MNRPVSKHTIPILSLLVDYRYLDAEMIYELTPAFSSLKRCQETLKKLADMALVQRIAHLEPHSTVGRAKYVYCISRKGARMLNEMLGLKTHASRRRPTTFLAHTLAINRFRRIIERAWEPSKIDLISLIPEYRGHYEQVPERQTLNTGNISFIPDLTAIIGRNGQRALLFFEIDLGSESMRTLVNKVYAYDTYYEANGFSSYNDKHYTFNGFRLLFVGEPKRFERLSNILGEQRIGQDWIWSNIHNITEHNLFTSPVWHVNGQENSHSIIERK